MKKIELLIATLFLARDVAHREHLASTSYSQHMALGDFYPAVIDLADSLTEAWQGLNGKLLDIPYLEKPQDDDILALLESQLEWIHENRSEAVPSSQTALHNIIDEVESLFMRTIYKLKFLK